MKRWRVWGTVVGTKYLGEFEANTMDDAIDKALESSEACVSMCHQCSGECEDPEIHEASADEIIEDEVTE